MLLFCVSLRSYPENLLKSGEGTKEEIETLQLLTDFFYLLHVRGFA